MTDKLIHMFRLIPKPIIFILGIILLLGIGLADYFTGLEVSISLFYLLPVILLTWLFGRWWGVLMSICSAITWFWADFLGASKYSHSLIPYWNATIIFGFFLIVSLIFSSLIRASHRERKLAKEIQQALFPKEIPQFKDFKFSAICHPSEEVGGDYFDIIALSKSVVGICIADVIGHGISAALLMSNLQAAVRILSLQYLDPEIICYQLNRMICNNTLPGNFITFFYGILDCENKRFVYANAGHNAPIIFHRDESILRLEEGGIALGIKKDASYQKSEISLTAGDRLLLFTDGVIELTNLKNEFFGEDKLIRLVKSNRQLGSNDLQKTIMQSVLKFSHGLFDDDITFIVVSVE